jgi:hypothetical protein
VSPRQLALTIALIGALFTAAVYVPWVGLAFVKDDFGWITLGIGALHRPLSLLEVDSSGFFFRPLVTLSFAGDYALYGLHARGFGVTNLLLTAGCVASIVWLLRTINVSVVAASVAALTWIINPHAIAMAMLWLSGRTSLLMTLFSVLSIVAVLRARYALAGLLLLAALFAKEDALVVPAVALAWLIAVRGFDRAASLRLAGWMGVAVAAYALLRLKTPAMMPGTAPSYYHFTLDPGTVALNLLSYLDRGATASAVIVLVGLLVYGTVPTFTTTERRWLVAAAFWFIAGIAITVWLPVRSDLYAMFSSVGAVLACAVVIDAVRRRTGHSTRDRVMAIVLAAIAAILVPAYWPRNDRFVEPARFAARIQDVLQHDRDSFPSTGLVVFDDEPGRFQTFANAMDGLATDAVRLCTGRDLRGEIVSSTDPAVRPDEVARYTLTEGRISRVR